MTAFRRSALLALALTTGVLLPGATASAANRGDKLDAAVRQRARQLTGRTRVIVEFTGEADVRVLGRRAGRRLDARTQVAEVENRDLAAIEADPRVRRVMLDRVAFATLERTGASTGATTVREELGLTGRGVGVAVIDSGISAHEDLEGRGHRSRIAHFKDFTRDLGPGLWISAQPSDEYGHGTHVAGIIAGDGSLSGGRRTGVAPGAHLIGLKVLDAEGHGYISDVIAAIDYAVAMRSAYNIRVINLSVASGVFESYRLDPLARAAKRAVDAGIIVVAAAGNLGRDGSGETQFGGITSPGNAPWVLTVGASSHEGTDRRSDDTIAAFSSRGPTWIDFTAKPDLVAPGVGIESLAARRSTLADSLPDYLVAGGTRGASTSRAYLSLSGTSMAAPVVAGTVALMLEANPQLTPNAVKAILQYTAQAGRTEHVLTQGAGLLNTRGAVRLARFFAAPRTGLGEMRDSIAGESIAWARHIIWGNYLVTGGTPLPGSNAWAADLPWGALHTRAGEPVVWGAHQADNIVWSTAKDENIVWSTAENIVWSTSDENNIVWSTTDDGNIVWSTRDDDNIVWSTAVARNVVWGDDCGGRNCARVVWGTRAGDRVWGAVDGDFNIVWSTFADENIVWSTREDDNIVWSTADDGNIVWSTSDDWNIVWSTSLDDNIVWSTAIDENIVWSTALDDNIVWSTAADENIVWSTAFGDNIVWSTGAIEQTRPAARGGR